MNRLAPLVARRTRVPARFASYDVPAPVQVQARSTLSDESRLFLTTLVGGLVFFTTYLA